MNKLRLTFAILVNFLFLLFLNNIFASQLHEAVNNGDTKKVSNLIDKGINVNLRDSKGYTALHYAVLQNDNNLTAIFIIAGANVNIKANNGDTPLHIATHAGNIPIIDMLHKEHANVNSKNKIGLTPLHIASMDGNISIIDIFIDEGANVNAQDINLQTPLHKAVLTSNIASIETLLDVGANPNTKDKEGLTPRDIAESKKLYKAVVIMDQVERVDRSEEFFKMYESYKKLYPDSDNNNNSLDLRELKKQVSPEIQVHSNETIPDSKVENSSDSNTLPGFPK